MPLSWNECKDRALAFSREWAPVDSEDAQAKSVTTGTGVSVVARATASLDRQDAGQNTSAPRNTPNTRTIRKMTSAM